MKNLNDDVFIIIIIKQTMQWQPVGWNIAHKSIKEIQSNKLITVYTQKNTNIQKVQTHIKNAFEYNSLWSFLQYAMSYLLQSWRGIAL